ncbi:MAG: M16 family metallopeptidase [Bacteroidales bacterium]
MKKLCLGIISILLSFCVFGQYELNDEIPFNESITYGKLDNGLTYYVKSNPKPENRAELTLVVNAGSVLEDEDQRGLAHFCEHMAFNGTENFPKHELIDYLESTGMQFGADVNAYTSFDETVYGITVPLDDEEMLDNGLLVLHDWAHLVSFEPEEIDAERGVIHEEWRMGQGAMDRLQREFLPKIFYNSKYAERLPIGKMDVVNNCEYETLKRFYKEWYRPELMALVAVGDFDEEKIEQKIIDEFSNIPESKDPRERELFNIPDHEETLVSVASDPEAPMAMVQLYTKHPIIKLETVDDYRKQMVSSLVSKMLNDRLKELTMLEAPPFVQGYTAHSNFIGTKSVYMGFALARNNDVETALEALVTENQRAKKHGFSETELERAKSEVIKEMEKAYNERNKRKSTSFVEEYKRHYLYPHDPVPGIEYEYEMYQKFIPEISLEQVNNKIDELVIDKNKVIVLVMPEKEGIEIPSEDEVLTAYNDIANTDLEPYIDKVLDKAFLEEIPEPKPAKEKTNKKLDYTEWEFDNGVRVIIKETDFKDDEVLFKAVSPGGSSLYGQKDDISADIVAGVARESGMGDYDKMELDKFLSDKDVSLLPFVNETSEGLNGKCSAGDIETLLKMIYLNFTKPRVTESGFNTYINKQESQLENKSLDPQSVWQDSIQSIMANYHPRRRPMTPEILGEANFSKIRYIMKSRFGDPGNFTFYFVGNISPEEVKEQFETYLGSLPKVNREESFKDLNIEPPSGIVDKTVYKGTDNKSMVVINFHGDMEYTVENRLHISAISKVLSTKLLEEIREEKSGVYTIGAYPNTRKDPKEKYRVTIFFSCDPERVDELTEGVFAEIEKLQQNGPTDKDLKKVIEKEKRAYEDNLQENRYWLNKLEEIEEGSIKDKDVNKYEKYIDKLDNNSLKEAANTFFDLNEYVRITLKPEKGTQEQE